MPKSWKEIRARKHGAGGLPPAGGGPSAPGSASAHLFAAAAHHFRAGNLDRAEQACRDALVFEPGHFDSLHLLGAIASRLGDHAAAVEILHRALASNGASPECRLNLGLCLVALGRREEAAGHFHTVTQVAPNFVNAYICLGNLFKDEQRLDEAAAQYRRALAVMPPNALALYNLGNVFLAQDRLDEAVAQYRRALEVDVGTAETYHNLAAALARQGQWDEAQAMYQRALSLKPDDPDTLNNLGNISWQQDRWDVAVAFYQRALVLRPDFIDAYNNLGNVLKKQGRGGEAFACFERALALDPDREDTQLNLCSTIYELGLTDRDNAVAVGRELLQMQGDKPLIRRGLSGLLNEVPAAENDADYARAVFDNFATTFDKTLTGLVYDPSALAQALDFADDAHNATLDVLDIGCGTGLCGTVFRPVARTLTGVDVSPKMLEKARALSIYDRLACVDAAEFMEQNFGAFDLIVSGDVLPYIGDLSRLLGAAWGALRARGRLAVSAESLDAEDGADGFQLAPSGRYKHSRAYLESAFAAAGFGISKLIAGLLREEAGRPVDAWTVVAQKRDPL